MGDLKLCRHNRILWFACWVTLSVMLINGIGLHWLTQRFGEFFESRGAELPLITLFFIEVRYLWVALPITAVAFLICLAKFPQHMARREKSYLRGMFMLWGVMFSLFSIWAYAMYAPFSCLCTAID